MKRRNFLQALGLATVVPAIPKVYYRHEDVPEVPEMEVVQEMIVKRETSTHSGVFERIEVTLTNAKGETLKNVNGWAAVMQECGTVDIISSPDDMDYLYGYRTCFPTRMETKLLARFGIAESAMFLKAGDVYSFEIKNPTAIIKGGACMLVNITMEIAVEATFLLQTPITVELLNT
jgi:hypothetical protein